MKLSIVIPICNTDYPLAHYTGNCLGSIKYFSHTVAGEREIIIIDNASTIELGGLKWDEVVDVYHKNDKNLGVPKAWNQGIELAKGEYVAILNSDIQVYKDWDLLMMDDLDLIELVMATPMYDAPYGRAIEADMRRAMCSNDPDKYLKEFADFSCFMAKKELFEELNGFDENYGYGYGEDVDFRLRMEQKGYKAKSDKRVAIHHVGMATGYTLKNQGEGIDEQMNKNREYTKKKHDLDKYGIPGWKRKNAKI